MKLLIVDDEIRAVQALVKRVNWQEYDFEPPLAAYSMAQAQGVSTAGDLLDAVRY